MRNLVFAVFFAAACAGAPSRNGAAELGTDDQRIAGSLAALLRAGRAVISQSQSVINDPSDRPKNLDGQTVLARAVAGYKVSTGIDPMSVPKDSREGRLLGDEMAAIKEVIDANQDTINALGTGFKGFIPAVFSRLVSESFSRRAAGEAEMKVTAPSELIRNRKARPDHWEEETIRSKFQSGSWPVGKSYEAITDEDSRSVFRIAVPEYYGASCLSCHGSPKGQLDITGYPKEGASVGDLGGVISIKLTRP